MLQNPNPYATPNDAVASVPKRSTLCVPNIVLLALVLVSCWNGYRLTKAYTELYLQKEYTEFWKEKYQQRVWDEIEWRSVKKSIYR